MERGFLMDLLDQMKHRRSVRSYTGQPSVEEALKKVLQAGLLSASSRSIRPWEFVVVRDRKMLQVLSECRIGSAKMLQHADCAIVVFADAEKSDVWVEDCSIAMANMHLMADALGLGSCWIQGRLREAPDGRSTEEYVQSALHVPTHYRLEAILSLGMPETHPAPHRIEELPVDQVHWEVF